VREKGRECKRGSRRTRGEGKRERTEGESGGARGGENKEVNMEAEKEDPKQKVKEGRKTITRFQEGEGGKSRERKKKGGERGPREYNLKTRNKTRAARGRPTQPKQKRKNKEQVMSHREVKAAGGWKARKNILRLKIRYGKEKKKGRRNRKC